MICLIVFGCSESVQNGVSPPEPVTTAELPVDKAKAPPVADSGKSVDRREQIIRYCELDEKSTQDRWKQITDFGDQEQTGSDGLLLDEDLEWRPEEAQPMEWITNAELFAPRPAVSTAHEWAAIKQ